MTESYTLGIRMATDWIPASVCQLSIGVLDDDGSYLLHALKTLSVFLIGS